jgi:energy-coupling factor transporter ATP-binding protein EcfA2
MASPPGFPRSLLGEPWSARLVHFQRYTVAHPQLVEAKERLVAAIQNAEQNSLVFVFGPTGVGKTTLRLETEQVLTAELHQELERDRGRFAVVSVEAVAPESGSFSWRDHFKRLLQEMDEPLIEYKRDLQTGAFCLRSPSRPKPTTGDYRYALEQALRYRRPAAVMIDEAQHLGVCRREKSRAGRIGRAMARLAMQSTCVCEVIELWGSGGLKHQVSR